MKIGTKSVLFGEIKEYMALVDTRHRHEPLSNSSRKEEAKPMETHHYRIGRLDNMSRLTDSQIRRISELALILAIPDQELENPMVRGRIKGLYERLVKEIDLQLQTIPRPDAFDIDKITALVKQFGIDSGWEGNGAHVATYISFCLGVVEAFDHKITKRTIDLMNDIFYFFDRGKFHSYRSYEQGFAASEKWEALFLTCILPN